MKLSIFFTALLTLCYAQFSLAGWWSGYTETKYPIVLVHGNLGFDELLGYEYFYDIPHNLERSGATVFVAHVAAVNSSEAKGEQLLIQVEEILALTGAEKVNLIGHSHGGPTLRYVASLRPELVASATSIASPHKGAPLGDVLENPDDPAAIEINNAVAELINFLSGGNFEQDAAAANWSLSHDGAAEFNALYPEGIPATECGEGDYEVNGVKYYSWSGTGVLTNLFDISDILLGLASLQFDEENDGFVGRCGSHMGMVIRDNYYMNHGDEINWLFGLYSIFDTSPISTYRQHANRLKNAGL
ncbi:MAG: triacylglycerol lipase [Bermanella sp.]